MNAIQKALRDVRHNAELIEAYGGVNVTATAATKPLLRKSLAAASKEEEDTVGFENDDENVEDHYFRENHITKGSKFFGANDFVSIDELRDDNPVDDVVHSSPSGGGSSSSPDAKRHSQKAMAEEEEGGKDHDEGEEGDVFDLEEEEELVPIDSMFLVAKAAPTSRK